MGLFNNLRKQKSMSKKSEKFIENMLSFLPSARDEYYKSILDTAIKYMGPKTKQLQIKADTDLGRI